MNTLYIIFIIMTIYILMYGMISLFAGVIPSVLVFREIHKNNKRYKDLIEDKKSKKISIILSAEPNINKFMAKVKNLLYLDYDNFDIYIINTSGDLKFSRKIINFFDLKKSTDSIKYKINKSEIISIYKNGKINLLNTEKTNKWNGINAAADNTNADLILDLEKNIFIEKNALKKLTREFLIDDDTLFTSGIIKDDSYIQRDDFEYKGIKTHNFFACFSILRNIKNKLFEKSYNFEFLNGEEIGNDFTLYNLGKIREVGGFNSETSNPNNDLKQRLTKIYKNDFKINYDALAFEEIDDIHEYVTYDIIDRYIIKKNINNANPFNTIRGLYDLFTGIINPILEFPIIILSILLTIIKVISPLTLLCFILLYISFDTVKNILLHITDKISLRENINISQSLEFIGFTIIYNFGFRQLYNLNKLLSRFNFKNKREAYYKEKEIYGYINEFELIEDKRYEKELTEYPETTKINDTALADIKEENKTSHTELNEIGFILEEENEEEITQIIEEINDIKAEEIAVETEDKPISKEEKAENQKEIINETVIEEDSENEETLIKELENFDIEEVAKSEPFKKEEVFKEKKPESELDRIMRELAKTTSKIEQLEAEVQKELSNIERRARDKDIDEELNKLKEEVLKVEENIDTIKDNKHHEAEALKEIASVKDKEDDELNFSDDEMDEEFSNITI
ncbi:hypothetical protein [uncultured Anaerofustis sp.]|uniref:hypothetical protein n=1 Tax=uncultured Anaerofustis sp. TaxID=904996 RepID=UPI0025E4B2CB|nr:hypothetical protein [uncultured Anaerofustis sp.]